MKMKLLRHSVILITIFNNAQPMLPCLNNRKVSNPKVEKVLNPPQNPVKMRSLKTDGETCFDSIKCKLNEKRRQAKTFEARVATGKLKLLF